MRFDSILFMCLRFLLPMACGCIFTLILVRRDGAPYNNILQEPSLQTDDAQPSIYIKKHLDVQLGDMTDSPTAVGNLNKEANLMEVQEKQILEQAGKENPENTYHSRCQSKKTNIAFAKTHKCGSSTLQNILFRFGYKTNLSFVLPPEKQYQFLAYCLPFTEKMVSNTRWHSNGYNIFGVHAIWNVSAISSIMPQDTLYISIVRNPVDVFDSLYHYYDFQHRDVFNITLNEYLSLSASSDLLQKRHYCIGRNQMLYDFGLANDKLFDIAAVKEKIEEIEKSFHFILIAEYFDESLILLKDLLCWKMEDILYISQNQRIASKLEKLTDWQNTRILALNKEDQLLYDYFLKKLKERMVEYGEEKLKREVEELRAANKKLAEMCITDQASASKQKGRFTPYGKGVQKLFVIDNEYCAQFATLEMYFMNVIRARQIEQAEKKLYA